MKSYYAPAIRCTEEELRRQIDIVTDNPIIDTLLGSVSGLVSVLDEHRQVIAINSEALRMFGFENIDEVLGLRIGNVIQCVHAEEEPGGCGTTKYCPSCGAAVAIVTSLGYDKPVERTCAATTRDRRGKTRDICLTVRSVPIELKSTRFLLLFVRDVTLEQSWSSLEKAFFHDMNNVMQGIVGSIDLLDADDPDYVLIESIRNAVTRLQNEMQIQRSLSVSNFESYKMCLQSTMLHHIVDEVMRLLANHPASSGKNITLRHPVPSRAIITDSALLLRILTNMLINALEASDEGESIDFWVESDRGAPVFCVWNKQFIPKPYQLRIFQRHFSTKDGAGRGVGTYSMKLFGEKILKGKVDFTSSKEQGTLFRYSLLDTYWTYQA